jgi:hypothetical protein
MRVSNFICDSSFHLRVLQKTKCFITALLLSTTCLANTDTNDEYQYDSFEDFQSTINELMGQDPNLDKRSTNKYLSSSMFNISGPLEVSTTWSDIYGPIVTTKYTGLLNPQNAFAIEGAIGAKENRVNLTFGHVLSPRQRMKITAERLAQKQAFDFYSGSIDEWVSQYAAGGEYQYLVGKSAINNISIGGYYARALDKSLDPILYLDDDNNYFINYRHIAGATSMGGNISLGLQPWKTGLITLTSYYDSVRYNSIYSDVSAEDSNTFGYGIELEQYLSSALKASLKYSARAFYDTIQAGIQFFHNIRHDKAAIGVSLGVSRTNYNTLTETNTANSSENAITIDLQYYFTPIRNAYTMPSFNFESLTSWVSNPAVRMETVLAAADQENIAAELIWSKSLTFTPVDINTEIISWSTNASSNVPDSSIAYYLEVTSEEDADFKPYSDDVTKITSKTITGLKPKTNYQATLSVTEALTQQTIIVTEHFRTIGGEVIDWNPNISSSNETTGSVLLSFTAPTRSVTTDKINYEITLTNTIDSSTHQYTISDSTVEAGQAVTLRADGLTLDTKYKITITATNDHEDYYNITEDNYFCQTAKEEGNLSYPIVDDAFTTPTSIQFYWTAPERYNDEEVSYTLTLINKKDDFETQHIYHKSSSAAAGATITFNTSSGDPLTPNTMYDVTLSATSDHTSYVETNTTAQTSYQSISLNKLSVAENTTGTSIIFEWKAPERYGNDQIKYTLTLTSEGSSSPDTHTYNFTSTDDVNTTITLNTANHFTLIPNTLYNVELSVEDTDHTKYNNDEAKTNVTTPFATPVTLNAPTAESSTATSIKFRWDSPERYGSDGVIYTLTLTNKDTGDKHTYTDISFSNDTSAGVSLTFDTASAGNDALLPNTTYDAVLSAENTHTAYQDSQATTGSTEQGKAYWSQSHPITAEALGYNGYSYPYEIYWKNVKLDPADNTKTIEYNYTIKEIAYWVGNPGTVVQVYKGTINRSVDDPDPSASSVRVEASDNHFSDNKYLEITVTASVKDDTNGNYQSVTTGPERVDVY